MKIKVSPSVLAADQMELKKEIERLNTSGADLVHIDIMDGTYVPNISLGFSLIKSIKKVTNIPLDVHLMIVNPIKYVERVIEYGADIVTIHHDSSTSEEVIEALKLIKKSGAKAGIAVSPAIDAKEAIKYLDYVDLVLVMTVNPGYGGQKFMDMSDKIKKIKAEIDKRKLNIDIEVDGGINKETAEICKDSGANILVAGTYVFGAKAINEAVSSLK